MAIAGLLVHIEKGALESVAARIQATPEMSLYDTRQEEYIVVVAEAPARQMEKVVERLKEIEGVLTIYTTYMTVEDEFPDTTC
jgi:nitrate reductase NapAB chaperone NapD